MQCVSYDELTSAGNYPTNTVTLTVALNDKDGSEINGMSLDRKWLASYFKDALIFNKSLIRGSKTLEELSNSTGGPVGHSDLNLPFYMKHIQRCPFMVVKGLNDIKDEKYVYPVRILGEGMCKQSIDSALAVWFPEKIVNDCRAGKCKILFHELWEGYSASTELLEQFFTKVVESFNIPRQSVGFVDGNIMTPYLQSKLGDIKGFYCSYFEDLMPDPSFVTPNTDLKREYYFLNLNRRLRPHRTIITAEFFNNDHKCLWTYLARNVHQNTPFPKVVRKSICYFNSLPKTIDVTEDVNDLTVNPLSAKAYIDVVSETRFYEKNTIFLSEKTFKPILAVQPFIIVGPVHSLKVLRSFGYKTFAPFINEEYDNLANPQVRMEAIIYEIRRLAALPENEMHRLCAEMESICLHNLRNISSRRKNNTACNDLFHKVSNWVHSD